MARICRHLAAALLLAGRSPPLHRRYVDLKKYWQL
jgi:hypothetical protein